MSNPTHGQKVTDPKAPKIQESSGPIASDSLAAESSTFQDSNDSVPLGVRGSNSTFANTDTSGATKLAAASNAVDRDGDETYSTSNPSKSSGVYNSTSSAGTAPSYVSAQQNASDGKAKGGEEGDFSSGMKNASFGTDIGGRNDPGRVATAKFATDASKTSSGLASVPKQEGDVPENSFAALGGDTSA